jgi:hypothetical protein
LSSKCPFYSDIQQGKVSDYDWVNSKCPLRETCPYYQKVAKDPKKLSHCPLLSKCPHYKDGHHGVEGDASKCPHFKEKKSKSCPFAGKKCPYMDTEHDKGCPAKEKCPYFNKLQSGQINDIDWKNNNCPLKEKCPYYESFSKNPSLLKKCPVYGKGDASKCPYSKEKEPKSCPYSGTPKCPNYVIYI